MLPQDRKAMGSEKKVSLYEGSLHSVKCNKIRTYEGRYCTARLLSKTDVNTLFINLRLPSQKWCG